MNMLTKNLIGGAVFGALAITGAVGSAAVADDVTDIRHKVIEIKAIKDKDTNITVRTDDDNHTLFFTKEELEDDNLIYDKVAHLDDETRDTVLQALENIKLADEHSVGVFSDDSVILNKGEGQRFIVMGSDDSVKDVEFDFVHKGDHKKVKKHVIWGSKDGVLKGHTDAIVTMIERGEFDQDQLDKIQAAVDSKR